jgi:hypothetical protein
VEIWEFVFGKKHGKLAHLQNLAPKINKVSDIICKINWAYFGNFGIKDESIVSPKLIKQHKPSWFIF